jgi:hypothetical protein
MDIDFTLAPVTNRTIVQGKRTLDIQVWLHGKGQLARDFLRRFRQAAASLEQMGVRSCGPTRSSASNSSAVCSPMAPMSSSPPPR